MIGFGPIFATTSKRDPDPCVGVDQLRAVCDTVRVPVIAIGGIQLLHASALAKAGAQYVAVIGAVCGADEPELVAHALHATLTSGL